MYFLTQPFTIIASSNSKTKLLSLFMKHYIFLAALFISLFSIQAQDNDVETTTNDKHELKLNALYLVIGSFEVSYEYLLNEESGVGISVFLPFDDDIKDDLNYYVSPYYRFYFGNKYAAGFFLEGFGMLNSTNWYTLEQQGELNPVFVERKETITDFALGIGLGGKWITKRGLLGEVNFGIGRNLFNSNDFEDNDFVGKIAITVGYRF